MILFILLMTIIVILVMITVFVLAIGGSAFIIVFGDVIVCIFLLIWVLKHIFHRKK